MRTTLIGIGALSFAVTACVDAEWDESDSPDSPVDTIEVAQDALTQRVGNDGSLTVYNGMGRNALTEEWRERCVTSPALTSTSSAESRVIFDRSMSESELAESLSFSFSGKAQYGLFSGSARASFARETLSRSRSINMVYSSRTLLDSLVLDTTRLTWQVPKTASNFYTRCGDTFVQEIKRGGELYVMLKMDFASLSDKTAFEASMSASYGLNSANAELSKATRSFSGRASIKLEAYQRGGETQRLANLFGGTSSSQGALAAITCSLDNMSACQSFMSNALSYATGTGTTQFPANLRRAPADEEYVLRDWALVGAGAAVQSVPAAVITARNTLSTLFKQQVDVRNRYQALQAANFYGAPASFQSTAATYDSRARTNVTAINNAALKCYDLLGNPPTAAQISACSTAATTSSLQSAGYVSVSTWASAMDTPLGRSTFQGRSDYVAQATPGVGFWGGWSAWAMCPAGTHAIGYKMRVEGHQSGDFDDTALNSVELTCAPWNRSSTYLRRPHDGIWGSWFPEKTCARGPMNGMRIDVEPSQGGGDDTGANNLVGSCVSSEVIQATGGLGWGSQKTWDYCPAGSAICGVQIRIEGSQGSGDDTAMNGVNLACCAY